MDIKKNSNLQLTKVDEDRKMVFGFFSINKIGEELLEDSQNDLIETEELEKAAYNFVLDARVSGEEHLRKGVGQLVESIVFTYEKQEAIQKTLQDFGIEDAKIDLGVEGWFGGFLITDEEVLQKVAKGEYPMFSVGGKAEERIELEDE